MPQYTTEELRAVMGKPKNIRNMSVIAHVDHGKSTLSDSLVAKAGLIGRQTMGTARYTDTRADEQERCITIKSTGVSLAYDYDIEDGGGVQPYLINLIDSPGHVDFSSEVTAALRVTDGALVVVDCVDGVCVQTETVLQQALMERIRPVLHLNKMDRAIMEQQKSGEELYLAFRRVVEDVNVLVSAFCDMDPDSIMVSPEKGTVSFGSGLQGWAFTIATFARMYSKKFGVTYKKLMDKLWGDSFFNPTTKKWSKVPAEGSTRAFTQFITDPIVKVCSLIMDGKKDEYLELFTKLGIELKGDDKDLVDKPLLKRIMQIWLNAGDTLLEMFITHLPSPVVAQRYRVEKLYSGPMDDEAALAIKTCDPNGPVMMFVSKLVPADSSRFYAFGRIFSGTIATGQKVRIQGPHYTVGGKEDLAIKTVQRTVVMMGRNVRELPDVPAGNTVALVGVDQYIVKTCTITTLEGAHNIINMKYSVSPVVRVAVNPKNPSDLPKLVEGIKRLLKSDPLVQHAMEGPATSQQHILAGCGELHMEICLKDLEEMYAQIPIVRADPVVAYRETVVESSCDMTNPKPTFMSKSPNKHNKLFMMCYPMDERLVDMIASGKVKTDRLYKSEDKSTYEHFVACGWSKNEVEKLWCYSPDDSDPCLLITRAVGTNLNDVKEHIVASFRNVCFEGPICGEPLRGVQFAMIDATLHADAIHRGAGQIGPTARSCMYGNLLLAGPRLQEPMFLVEIKVPKDKAEPIYSLTNRRRGAVFESIDTGNIAVLKCHLPVAESFGFTNALRACTGGRAFPTCTFDHWATMDQSVEEKPPEKASDKGSAKVYDLVRTIRKRKGKPIDVPKATEEYLEKALGQ